VEEFQTRGSKRSRDPGAWLEVGPAEAQDLRQAIVPHINPGLVGALCSAEGNSFQRCGRELDFDPAPSAGDLISRLTCPVLSDLLIKKLFVRGW
jgi:hypothetical protein